MKILSLFTFLLLATAALCVIFVPTKIAGDGKHPEDFACQICRDFVRRVILENESPRTACRPKQSGAKMLDGCHFMLKEHKLIAKSFDLRARFADTDPKAAELELRDLCHLHTKSEQNNEEGFCPLYEETFGRHRLTRKLFADSANMDIRVAPASSFMNPHSVRVTVIDNTAKNHSAAFLSQFSYNEKLKFYATEKTVHTGVFPVNLTGGRVNITLGNGEFILPVKTAKPGQGIRALFFGDPCESSEWVGCEYGKKWKVQERLTEILNLVSAQEDALHAWGIVGDIFYDPLLVLAPQFFTQLSANVLGTPTIFTIGNHEQMQHGGCDASHTEGVNTFGSSYIQYYGQNTVASHFGGPTNPFNFSNGWTPANKKIAPVENYFSTTSVGNVGFITFNGANTREETDPYFAAACKWVKKSVDEDSLAFVIVFTHWSELNCLAQKGMWSQKAYDHLITLDGCKENADRMKWIEGHSHMNKVIRKDVGFRFGGAGMGDKAGPNFGFGFVDTFHDKIEIRYFPIADPTNDGNATYTAIKDCIKEKGGLHQCYHLSKNFLTQAKPNSTSLI